MSSINEPAKYRGAANFLFVSVILCSPNPNIAYQKDFISFYSNVVLPNIDAFNETAH